MKHYLDITLLPDAEANLGFLWQKVFQQVHIALADNKVSERESAVAISIVCYGDKNFPLGNKLRLFATNEEQLHKINVGKWLARLTDYCHISSVKSVPSNVGQFACFRQKRIKGQGRLESQLLRKAKHISEKFNVDYNKCLTELTTKPQFVESTLPFIYVESQETKKRLGSDGQSTFPMFIDRELSNQPVAGKFDCYGLSKTATVPWF
ncbi:type I-F CRISPR-associated endoribonuclease Cas6/Csy4 [Glaciecola sp. SC05]|uniref:type I-F CRISPR-associated endoribonuclease Cas6/Csy4 n=1 Tax=Glaciecola sp. SC05 TaxID=1987355 RepID=UPI0035282179